MAFLNRLGSLLRTAWPWLRIPFWLVMGLLFGFLLPYTLILNARLQERFNDLVFAVPTRVYARPLPLEPGRALTPAALELELTFAGYTTEGAGKVQGSYSKNGSRFIIASHGYFGPDGGELPHRIRVVLANGQVASVVDDTNDKPIKSIHLDPARIATLYGAQQEERRIVRLENVPPLLVQGLQAVEDRDFKNHIGLDFSAIARASVANIRAGHTVQGGSTLTQQLVRNLFLDRDQNMLRKVNEAILSLLMEAHYPKGRILEAYVNEVFLGQQGNQAVHGFAAGGEFFFGRRLEDLRPQEIALLIGLVKGPSYYDPRRYPDRALSRRNLVLQQFHDTGLLDDAQTRAAQAAPLGIAPNAQLPHNRFPAFMQLVRSQITADFDEAALRDGSLSIFTTLDPTAQLYTEQAIVTTMKSLGKRGAAAQAAAVVTDTTNGSVLAVVGSRDPGEQGFNRALDARRSIGSLVKPLVYLVALAQPSKWSLASIVDDSPINMRQPDGTPWTPQNDDREVHGQVPMLDALVHSWNLATVNLGMQVGVGRVKGFLESFGLEGVNPSPSLLLGAIDISPLQVAQLYEYIAADGHALPLVAVRGVMDSKGQAIKRYEVKEGEGEYQTAARLTTWAMQQVVNGGTAAAIGNSNLAYLHAAGKTGTSDSQRDAWFAGFTGDRLAVIWMGRDDNKPTGLYGATGSMKVWQELFRKLPTRPLSAAPGEGLEMAYVNPQTGKRTDPSCEGARQFPFVSGYVPEAEEGCFWQRFKGMFGGGDGAAQPAPPVPSNPTD
ncbi:MAG: penicillin-binding protein 1B [Luteibacter sp.]|uniref:penicillin-binding protein 1B n=1 Tax=Luteibacter TaxID=242605 RepID=UPI0005616126|nr:MULTISPECIES: penicillin-binding protein 1B [unclassified Luteibacter]MDQ7997178.1 penicillin-binding protein 1B [Luteibacter sp.]MDQ8049916.1 penicillin-binding protein 1B [Luteibacter sp.]MDR6644624.1 penicillin-binding protein 1B [Luteibacter sp. 1214]